jgi:phospholipid/cholesterol/gamma-HCH transport system ATP-binding protein
MLPKSNLKNPVIEFRNVSVAFDQKPALRNVTFNLLRGQMMLVTGVSQSGKSVLLRLAAGLLRPDDGQILIEGREIQNIDEDDLLQIRAGSMGIVSEELIEPAVLET